MGSPNHRLVFKWLAFSCVDCSNEPDPGLPQVRRILWNKVRIVKDPTSGKRILRINPKERIELRGAPTAHHRENAAAKAKKNCKKPRKPVAIVPTTRNREFRQSLPSRQIPVRAWQERDILARS